MATTTPSSSSTGATAPRSSASSRRACATAAAPRTSCRRSSSPPCAACARPTPTITFRPWIFEIAKNAAIDHYRRTSRAEEVSIHADDALRPADQLRLVGWAHTRPENAILHKERFDQLRDAFAELSTNHHRVLVLREFEGLSYREIAQKMDMTRPAVESALFRARRRLQQEYARAEAVA